MRRVPVLIPFLAFVALLFIGILIFTWVETKKANPQMIRSSGASVLQPPVASRQRLPA